MQRLSSSILPCAMAIASLFSLGIARGADDSPPPGPDKGGRVVAQACRADAERLCADIGKGGGRKLICLREHDAQLTPACRDGLAAMTTNRKNIAPK